jgi:hypothetical protein
MGTTPAVSYPHGPFCRDHAQQMCRMAKFAKARRYKDPQQVWRSPWDLLPPHTYREVESWDEHRCWACHLVQLRFPITLNRLVAPDPIGRGPAQHGRGRPLRSASEVLAFLLRADSWLDEQEERPKLKDFALHEAMHPSTVRHWLRAAQRYGFSFQRKWSRVITFRTA